jgi:hypothetical protein
MLAFDPRSKTWAVVIRVGFDRDDAPMLSLFEAWGPRFYAALRFAMSANDNDVADILDGDPANVIVPPTLTERSASRDYRCMACGQTEWVDFVSLHRHSLAFTSGHESPPCHCRSIAMSSVCHVRALPRACMIVI